MTPHFISNPSEQTGRKDNNDGIEFSSVLQAEMQPKSKFKTPLRTIFPPLELEEHPIDVTPELKAIVVGAGIAGINAGILLPRKVPGLTLIIYEKTSDVVSQVIYHRYNHDGAVRFTYGFKHRAAYGTQIFTPESNATFLQMYTRVRSRHPWAGPRIMPQVPK